MKDPVQISPALRAVPIGSPFGEPWWALEVLHDGQWVMVQSGPPSSNLWFKLGVSLPV